MALKDGGTGDFRTESSGRYVADVTYFIDANLRSAGSD